MIKKIKGGLCAVIATALLAAPALSFATPLVINVGDKIRFADGPGDNDTLGGLFNLSVYATTNTSTFKGSFQSLCVERDETISFGSTFYNVAGISTAAINGGVNVPGAGSDALDVRTAWLFTNFIETPTALNSVGTWASASAEDRGTAMQLAIWLIEEEITTVTHFGASVNTAASNLASSLITAAGASGWTDTGRVFVLNMATLSGGAAQDQLYISPVPEPESYAMLAMGLGLLGWVCHRKSGA